MKLFMLRVCRPRLKPVKKRAQRSLSLIKKRVLGNRKLARAALQLSVPMQPSYMTSANTGTRQLV